jgi:inositol-pentakisphosphate 2-kinase
MACTSSQSSKTDKSSISTPPGVLVTASYDDSAQTYFIKSDNSNHDPPPTATESRKCLITYLDEGGANFVFTLQPISQQSPSTSPSRLDRKLLRLPKNHAHVLPADAQLITLQHTFGTLFPPHNLIQSSLIHLDNPTITALNTHLQTLPPTVRPSKRCTDYLPLPSRNSKEESTTTTTALLITSMTPSSPSEILVQLKPKWLSPSLTAPAKALRCRTCALRAQRTAFKQKTASDEQEICPLALVHSDESVRRKAFGALTEDGELSRYLASDDEAQGLLKRLRDLQVQFDRVGVLRVSGEEVEGVCKAMTLRDCTLYVRKTAVVEGGGENAGGGGGGSVIEARLGDLDLKLPARLEHWRSIERGLIEGGWYMNEEDEAVHTLEKICVLSVNGA